jgi:hypothetical protein
VNRDVEKEMTEMPRYIPVTRVITIEFRPVEKPKGRVEVVVTPEYAVVRSGDTIQWHVQGLPARVSVTVGNFAAFGAAATVKVSAGKVRLGKPTNMRDAGVKLVRGVATYETKHVDLGNFKYDVLIDGTVVFDPEIEIRGPRTN